MAEKRWETIKVGFCDRAGCEVSLEAEFVYPAEFMPDQPARLLSKRCSQGLDCNTWNTMTCVWAGTNPMHDPLMQR